MCYVSKQQILVLLYKDFYFSTNDLDFSLLGAVVSLVQGLAHLFHEKIPHRLLPLRVFVFRIDFIPSCLNANEVISFHGIANSFKGPCQILVKRNFVFKFHLNVNTFKDSVHERAFNILKDKLTNALLLCLPNFDKASEVECVALLSVCIL